MISVFTLDPRECAEPCWSQNPLQFHVWRCQEHPAKMSLLLFEVEWHFLKSSPNMLSQNEMLRRRISKWRAGCQFHHHLAWRRHLSKMCFLLVGGLRWNNQTWKNFCLIGPRRLRPGWISASGLSVSTVVDIIATNQPFDATWWNTHWTRELWTSVRVSDLIGCGNHRHVNVWLSSNLFLWDDDLGW